MFFQLKSSHAQHIQTALLICRARKLENSTSSCSPWVPIVHNTGIASPWYLISLWYRSWMQLRLVIVKEARILYVIADLRARVTLSLVLEPLSKDLFCFKGRVQVFWEAELLLRVKFTFSGKWKARLVLMTINTYDGTKTMKASCIMSLNIRHNHARFDNIFITCGNLLVIDDCTQSSLEITKKSTVNDRIWEFCCNNVSQKIHFNPVWTRGARKIGPLPGFSSITQKPLN